MRRRGVMTGREDQDRGGMGAGCSRQRPKQMARPPRPQERPGGTHPTAPFEKEPALEGTGGRRSGLELLNLTSSHNIY